MSVGLDRTAASLFSTALLRPVVRGKPHPLLNARLEEYRLDASATHCSNSDVLRSAYARLQRRYRNEYVYKNSIAQRLFIGRHKASNAAFLQEVPVQGSVADCLFVNGGVTVYEIKTELDSSARLRSQVEDYYRVANQVFIVTHRTLEETYRELLADLPVGLIVMNRSWGMSTRKPATEHTAELDHQALFDLLRVDERRSALERASTSVPDVPNGKRHAAWLEKAKQVRQFQTFVASELKNRQRTLPDLVVRDPKAAPLRSALLKIGVSSGRESGNVDRWLREETKCTSHT